MYSNTSDFSHIESSKIRPNPTQMMNPFPTTDKLKDLLKTQATNVLTLLDFPAMKGQKEKKRILN